MRATSKVLTTVLFCGVLAGLAFGAGPSVITSRRPLFNTSGFRPQIVLHEIPASTDAAFVSLTGVIFSHAQVDKITVGERSALTRPAEPKDLARLQRVPEGASDAPFRTYFEVPDAALTHVGANDLDVIAYGNDGRVSNVHRVTLLRSTSDQAAK